MPDQSDESRPRLPEPAPPPEPHPDHPLAGFYRGFGQTLQGAIASQAYASAPKPPGVVFTVKRASNPDADSQVEISTLADLMGLAGPRNCELIITPLPLVRGGPVILICDRHME